MEMVCPHASCILIAKLVTPKVPAPAGLDLVSGGGGDVCSCMLVHPTSTCTNVDPDHLLPLTHQNGRRHFLFQDSLEHTTPASREW